MSDEFTESGDPVYRYEEPEKELKLPDMEDSSLEEIEKHITRHIGKIDTVWHELVSTIVHIDVHQINPTEERPYWTLVTSGMSDLPMAAAKGSEYWRYAELMICLPPEWPLVDKEESAKEKYHWATRWLKMLARFPHEYATCLAWGHTMPNGDPPEPLADGVDFSGMILLSPRNVRNDFLSLKVREDKVIHFYSIVPMYAEEMDLKLRKGARHIDNMFKEHNVTEVVDVGRSNLALSEE